MCRIKQFCPHVSKHAPSHCNLTSHTSQHLIDSLSITSDTSSRSLSLRWEHENAGSSRTHFKQLLCLWSVYILGLHTGGLTPVTLSTGASWEFAGDERSVQMSSVANHCVACGCGSGPLSLRSGFYLIVVGQRILHGSIPPTPLSFALMIPIPVAQGCFFVKTKLCQI